MNWDQYYKEMCLVTAKKSKDNSTQVGCIIVGSDHEIRSTGYNDFPRRVLDTLKPDNVNDTFNFVYKRRLRPQKYLYTEHAERNAIYNAAMCGIALKGCSIYIVPSRPLFVCSDCCRAIIQAGLIEVVIDNIDSIQPEQWDESCKAAKIMFEEAGVKVRKFNI